MFGAVFVALTVGASFARAQSGGSEEVGKLRERAEQILSEPEFRHLIRSRRTDAQPRVQSSSGSGEGGSQSGDGTGDGSGGQSGSSNGDAGSDADAARRRAQANAREQARRMRERRDRARRNPAEPPPPSNNSSDSSDSSSPANLPSFGGGIASILGPIMQFFAWLIIAAVIGLIVWLVIAAIRNRERPGTLNTKELANVLNEEPDKAPGDTAADVYVARAREFASRGLYREAVAALLLGAMSHIERAGMIRFRRGLTHRDYLRAVRPKAGPYRSMEAMVGVYEPLGFGRREATNEHFTRTLSEYESGFHVAALADA